MEIRKLKNPTDKDVEFTFGGQNYTVKAGTEESFEGKVVKHYLAYTNGTLIDPADEPVKEPKVEKK